MHEQAGKVLEAIPLFRESGGSRSRIPSSYYHLARDYQKVNQPEKAAEMLNKLKEIELTTRREISATRPKSGSVRESRQWRRRDESAYSAKTGKDYMIHNRCLSSALVSRAEFRHYRRCHHPQKEQPKPLKKNPY